MSPKAIGASPAGDVRGWSPAPRARRKSETLEAFQALEEGRVERLDGKTPLPPSKGRLGRRQSSPSLPREVSPGCLFLPLFFPLFERFLLAAGCLCAWGCDGCSASCYDPTNPHPTLSPSSLSLPSVFSIPRGLFALRPLGPAALLAPRAAQQRPQRAPALPQPGSASGEDRDPLAPRVPIITGGEGLEEAKGLLEPHSAAGEGQQQPALPQPQFQVGAEGREGCEPSPALGERLEEPNGEGPSCLAGWERGENGGEEEPGGFPAPPEFWEGLG